MLSPDQIKEMADYIDGWLADWDNAVILGNERRCKRCEKCLVVLMELYPLEYGAKMVTRLKKEYEENLQSPIGV